MKVKISIMEGIHFRPKNPAFSKVSCIHSNRLYSLLQIEKIYRYLDENINISYKLSNQLIMKESSTHLPIYQIPHASLNAYELGLL